MIGWPVSKKLFYTVSIPFLGYCSAIRVKSEWTFIGLIPVSIQNLRHGSMCVSHICFCQRMVNQKHESGVSQFHGNGVPDFGTP